MITTISTACPACIEGQVDVEVDYDRVCIYDVRIVDVSCGCELDPSQREAVEREAIKAIESGEVTA